MPGDARHVNRGSMSGDDLTIRLFFIGTAFSLAVAAMSQAGWKHPVLIRGLFGVAVGLAAVGLGWPSIKTFSPVVTATVDQIATNPVAWFVVFMFGLMAVLFLSKPREQKAASNRSSTVVPTQPPPPYLAEIAVFSGSPAGPPQFPTYRIKFARGGERARILVDFSAFLGGIGGPGWAERTTLVLQEIGRFSRGEVITGDLISANSFESQLWWWNTPAETHHWINPRCMYRGRLVFQAEDGTEEWCSFVILQPEGSKEEMPTVVGHQFFDFMREWES
jgi:hypothetical protein